MRFIAARLDQTDVAQAPASSDAASSLADTNVEPAVTDPPAVPSQPGLAIRSSVRDLTYGDSAKAMVDEVIWNMETGDYEVYRTALQQGKTPADAARAAGGQLAVIHRKIADYTLKLQSVLSESKRTINVEETIDKPLEQTMLEIISNGAMSDLEKDAFMQKLGTLQEWVKHGLQGDITALQAHRIMLAIGDRLNWGGSCAVSENVKPIYRVLYGRLKTAIRAAVPEAQNLHDRLTNLYAAKSDMDQTVFALRCSPAVCEGDGSHLSKVSVKNC